MAFQKHSPKSALSYLTIVSDMLRQHKHLHSPRDVTTTWGIDSLVDITDIPEFESVTSIEPLPKEFNERLFLFKESTKRHGVIEAAFHRNKLVHLRVTMHFSGWFPRMVALKFFTKKLLPTVTNIIGSIGSRVDEPYPGFYWENYQGFYIVFTGLNKERGYISTYLNHTDYLKYF